MSLSPALLFLLAFALLVNIPLGYLREGTTRFSLSWFLYIHLSIPFLVALRLTYGFGWEVTPFSIALAVAGQLVGGRLRRRAKR